MKRSTVPPPLPPSSLSTTRPLRPVQRLSPAPQAVSHAPGDQRRSPRIDLEIVVGLDDGSAVHDVRACDLSTRGLFIKSDRVLPLRRLVRLLIDLDDGGEPLRAMAMVARSVSPDEARAQRTVPGFGVQLYSLGTQDRARWARFLGVLAERYAASAAVGPAPVHLTGARQAPVDAVRRLHTRYDLSLETHLITASHYERTRTHDISLGGASLYTEHALEVGDAVDMVLLGAPADENDGQNARLELEARVVRRFVAADRLAVAVAFTGLDDPGRSRLEQLILGALPEADDADQLVEEDDPLLE